MSLFILQTVQKFGESAGDAQAGFGYTFAFKVCIFFFQCVNSNITWVHCAGDKFHCSCTVHRSHGTIHILKIYFATVFSVFSFQFQQK